ncbi:MAG TPA: hypothetical protein VHG28_09850 [Longimicrobiaceae bacterium]|nr:hypothetical protein [Longimicrobiaceae bacterium]
MFARCIFCHAQLPENQSLEHLRRGRKVAFDPERGRLWTICAACSRWNLAPIEERWEALEELEWLSTDRARLLSRTDNIALLRAEDLEVVRVGRAGLTEEAWWRYGRDLLRRRKQSYLLQGAEVAAMVVAAVASGGALVGWAGQGVFVEIARWRRFGRVAIRGRSECPRCGSLSMEVKFRHADRLLLVPGGEHGEVALLHTCSRCGSRPESGHLLAGVQAERVLRRILAYRHFHGASEGRIRAATSAIEHAGSVEALTRRVAEQRLPLGALRKKRRTEAIALEIAVNDEVERRLLRLELAELERRWREEEEIAAIADRELSFAPGLDRLLGRTREGGEGAPTG